MKKIFIILFAIILNTYAFEHLTVEDIDEKLNGKKVVIDFYATWCPPCKIIDKNLKSFDKSKADNITIYKIDIDAQRDLLKKFNIVSIPTLVFVDNGELKHSQVGVQTLEEITSNVNKYLLK